MMMSMMAGGNGFGNIFGAPQVSAVTTTKKPAKKTTRRKAAPKKTENAVAEEVTE